LRLDKRGGRIPFWLSCSFARVKEDRKEGTSMLRIRPEQYDALDADMRSRYCKSLLKFYRDTISQTVAPYDDATLLNRIVAAEGRGRQWGIALQDEIGRAHV